MSFLGFNGYVMTNSGILELLSTAYTPNSAKQMLEGKQYEKAIRGHDLLTTALKKIILQQVIVNNEYQFQNIITKYNKLLEDGIGKCQHDNYRWRLFGIAFETLEHLQ